MVDYERCRSNAVCMSLAPTVFEVRADGNLYVLDERPPAELRPLVDMAVQSCPTEAISVEDD